MKTRSVEYQYVYDTYINNNYTSIGKWVSKDPDFQPVSYVMKDNIVWNENPICHNDSFFLLLYFVHQKDVERRSIIREFIKQGMIVDGERINYAFVVVSSLSDNSTMERLNQENCQHGDILISIHEDNYRLLPVTVLDAFYWVREHCKTVKFVGKIDGDTWVHIGRMVQYYKSVVPERVLSGFETYRMFKGGRNYKAVHNIPFDYPKPIIFAAGGAYVVSRDVIPFINIGASFVDVILPISEDIVVTEILRRAGIFIQPMKENYTLYMDYDGSSLPENIVFLHNIKNLTLFRYIYHNY